MPDDACDAASDMYSDVAALLNTDAGTAISEGLISSTGVLD